MNKQLTLLVLLIVTNLLTACTRSNYYKDEHFNPDTGKVEHVTYSPYFQLKTELLPEQLELTLVSQLNKDTLRSIYRIKEKTRRLLPNDYMDNSDVFLYFKNLTSENITFQLNTIILENQRLPLSTRSITIKANEKLMFPLGQVRIDLRKSTLNCQVDFTSLIRQEVTYDLQRIVLKEPSEKETESNELEDESVTDQVIDWFMSLDDKLFD